MVVVFFFNQKTAYEMRISDWSSDVCSSDLNDNLEIGVFGIERSDVEAQAASEKLCFKTNLEKAGELRCERRRFRLWRENSLRETPALEPAATIGRAHV